MNISPKERFLDICHFKRPSDLYMPSSINPFWEQTLEKWIGQGTPKEIIHPGFHREYFQFQHIRTLTETNSSAIGEGREELRSKIDLGHGITVPASGRPLVPNCEPRFISEDERTVTLRNGKGQTVKYIKDRIEGMMPMYLDWPVKDRATWNEHKKRLDPNTPERWPSDWDAFVQKMNGKSEPLSLRVGGFYGFLRDWVGSERILYMFYDAPGLIEDMMEQWRKEYGQVRPHNARNYRPPAPDHILITGTT